MKKNTQIPSKRFFLFSFECELVFVVFALALIEIVENQVNGYGDNQKI